MPVLSKFDDVFHHFAQDIVSKSVSIHHLRPHVASAILSFGFAIQEGDMNIGIC